jgi:hypothetical protein
MAMSFKTEFPEYLAIEEHIRRAHAERSLAIAHFIAGALARIGRGLKKLGNSNHLANIADKRAIEADAFLKRSVPRY